MKCLLAHFTLLLTASLGQAHCTVVEVVATYPSSQNAVLTVLKDGEPVQGVRVNVTTADGQQKLSLSTDSRGRIQLPYLAPGRYCVSAATAPTLRGDLCLDVSNRHLRNPSAFSLTLMVKPPPPPSFEERLSAAETAPVSVRTQSFVGVVVDPSTAVIPGTHIAIYQRDFAGKAHPVELTTDQQGRFSARLTPGTYVAVFQQPGFETEFVTFEIAPDGSGEDLRVSLKLGACT